MLVLLRDQSLSPLFVQEGDTQTEDGSDRRRIPHDGGVFHESYGSGCALDHLRSRRGRTLAWCLRSPASRITF